MTQVKHTTGPWHRNIKPARQYPTVWAGRNTHIAVLAAGAPHRSGDGGTMSDEELEANISLIAAAPEMLEALKGLIRFRNWEIAEGGVTPTDLISVWKEAEAAIAKAEGRS